MAQTVYLALWRSVQTTSNISDDWLWREADVVARNYIRREKGRAFDAGGLFQGKRGRRRNACLSFLAGTENDEDTGGCDPHVNRESHWMGWHCPPYYYRDRLQIEQDQRKVFSGSRPYALRLDVDPRERGVALTGERHPRPNNPAAPRIAELSRLIEQGQELPWAELEWLKRCSEGGATVAPASRHAA